MDKAVVINHLQNAMGELYRARYEATGPEGPVDSKYYPEMDRQTFDEIVHLQDAVQRLMLRLQQKDVRNGS